MKISRRTLLSAVALSSICATVQAGSFPIKPITLIAPFAAGSSSDVTARAIAQKISASLGQPVIVENRPGANGGIGMRAVVNSKPDGYTLAVATVSSTVVPPLISKQVPFDLFKQFTPVATMANTPLVLTVPGDSPIQTVADLIAAAKKTPDTMSYGDSAGLYRIIMEALNTHAGTDLLGIPFKGSGQAMTEMLAGRISVNPDALGAAAPMLQSKRIKAIATLGSSRTPLLPDVPTMQEQGFKDFVFNGWLGILAPTGTPPAHVEVLHKAIEAAVQTPDIQALYQRLGMEPTVLSPEAYAEAMQKDSAWYASIAQRAGIEKQ